MVEPSTWKSAQLHKHKIEFTNRKLVNIKLEIVEGFVTWQVDQIISGSKLYRQLSFYVRST